MDARSLLICSVFGVAALAANEKEEVVFRSDVVLVRVDAQVVDSGNRAITGLDRTDFVLREQGRDREIRNFARDEMPVDILLLLDVSGSMRPHVERVARAAGRALDALGKDDRVAIMVFDRATRVRAPFRAGRAAIVRDLENVLHQESFDGGTDITKALLEAARWVDRNARRDARRAIVILTDDQTEFEADPDRVIRALLKADTVLSGLIAPDALGRGRAGSSRRGVGWPPAGGTWPGGWPGGGGTWPGGGPRGGGPSGPVWRTSRTRAAGTAEIARESGGDSLRVDEASAFETTLERIRQRYALYFLLPDGAGPGEQRSVEVELAASARRRHPGAEVRYRRAYVTPASTGPAETPAETVEVSRETSTDETVPPAETPAPNTRRRRPAVNERTGPAGPLPSSSEPSWGAGTVAPPASVPAASDPEPKKQGGWRRVDEPEPASAQVSQAPKSKYR